MDYFIWDGVDSRKMGLWVESLPPITRPPMRFQQVTIPGRAGALTVREDRLTEPTDGAETYERYIRECRIMPKPGADIHAIVRWLSSGQQSNVVFSHEPNRKQRAEIVDQFDLQHVFASQREATVRFLCDPFKTGESVQKVLVGLLEPDTTPLYNPGDVIAWPKIHVRGSGSIAVTIEGITITFGDVGSAPVTADCGAGFMYTGTEVVPNGISSSQSHFDPSYTDIVPAKMYGDFPYLRKGSNTITYQGNVTMLVVAATWRYL